MNMIKGLDRIALVLAIIAIVPIFLAYYIIFQDKLITLNPMYEAWEKCEKTGDCDKIIAMHAHIDNPEERKFLAKMEPYKYIKPPIWKVSTVSAVTTFLGFFVVLFGFRGLIRLFAWIVAGFKDKYLS